MAHAMNTLPDTDSITALAEFWQTHDLTDFDDALVEVTGPVLQRVRQLSFSLPAEDALALHAMAQQESVSAAVLVTTREPTSCPLLTPTGRCPASRRIKIG